MAASSREQTSPGHCSFSKAFAIYWWTLANLSAIRSEAKDRPPPRPTPDVTPPNESARILTISCAPLLWISAIIAPHVDTCRRAQIDVFVRAAAALAAPAVAGFHALTGLRFRLLLTNLRLNAVAPTSSHVLFKTPARSISEELRSVTVSFRYGKTPPSAWIDAAASDGGTSSPAVPCQVKAEHWE